MSIGNKKKDVILHNRDYGTNCEGLVFISVFGSVCFVRLMGIKH